MKKKILIVVDMQNDFITGSLGNEAAKRIVPNVLKKIEEYEANGDTIYYTLDTHFDSYLETHEGKILPIKHCIYGTNGWNLQPEIQKHSDQYKHAYKFSKKAFAYDWRGYKFNDFELELVGLMGDICVISNALMLRSLYPEADIKVDALCCAGTDVYQYLKALDVMTSCHIEIENSKQLLKSIH